MSSQHLSHVARLAALCATLIANTALAQEPSAEGAPDADPGIDDSTVVEAAPEPAAADAAPEPEVEEAAPQGKRASRLHNHATALGWHAVIFRTEDGDRYVLNGPSISYDYFVGRTHWGFAVHGATYLPLYGRFDGPNNYQGALRKLYGDRHYGFDLLLQVAYHQQLNEELDLFFGGGFHVQSFSIDGEDYLPVEAITCGLGGSVRLQWNFHPHMHVGTTLTLGMDPIDLVRHYNRAVLTGTLDGSLFFGVRF